MGEPSAFNRRAFEEAFRDFVSHTKIITKNEGLTAIKLYRAQEYALSGILDGLENDIHYFVILKARQLGITTITLLLDLFWCGLYPGLQGAIVTDTDPNKEKLRLLVQEILDNLPPSHPLPVAKHNRNGIVFRAPHAGASPSMIDYLVAGTKKRTGSLGRSRALNFCHMTEAAQYGDEEGWESLKSAFSHRYPARLYVVESTAHGYNLFHNEWEDAVADDIAKKAVFIGWWQHDDYQYERGTPLFQRYGYADLSDDEREVAEIVKTDYGWEITREQWAWYRHRKDPQRRANSEEIDSERAEMVEVEYPSHPEEAFRMSGSPFLPGKVLDESMKTASKRRFKGYTYHFGLQFTAMRRQPVGAARIAQLKVWEEPVPHGRYIVAADPAYGASDTADRFCVEVLRCYSDRLEQVAEFCTTACEPFQFTWVLADLCGWYGSCRWILEIQGPGAAVMTEFRHLQTLLSTGKLAMPGVEPDEEPGIDPATGRPRRPAPSPLANVRTYLYHRPDALSGSYNIHWQTSHTTKPPMMAAFGDYFLMGQLIVNSVQAHVEMKTLVRKGISVEADGNKKDDRPLALAMGVRAWIDWERDELQASGRSYAVEKGRDEADESGNINYMGYVMNAHFQRKATERRDEIRRNRKSNWNWIIFAVVCLSSLPGIADRYGMSRSNVRAIVSGATWRGGP